MFVDQAKATVDEMFPTSRTTPTTRRSSPTGITTRIRGYIDDAGPRAREIVEINPAGEDFSQQEHRKIPPTLIIDPTDDMR